MNDDVSFRYRFCDDDILLLAADPELNYVLDFTAAVSLLPPLLLLSYRIDDQRPTDRRCFATDRFAAASSRLFRARTS